MTEGSYNIVRALRDGICEGIKKGWPDEAEGFSGVVVFCLEKWANENFPEEITFRFSELAEFLGLPDAENAKEMLERFIHKIVIHFEYESNYVFEIIGDLDCPDEIKKVSIKDKPELFDGNKVTSNIPLFLDWLSRWNKTDKDGEATITIYKEDELRERIINEDLSNFKIELTTPYLYDGKDIMEWWETGKTIYQKNADEQRIKVTTTVKFNEVE